ncbi:MAG: molecular chaperone GrpE [Clostridiales bacterium]|jgi:molecular chaperone GrpE|nr:molecular chaperone GrpE [Clostridiales bacterium]
MTEKNNNFEDQDLNNNEQLANEQSSKDNQDTSEEVLSSEQDIPSAEDVDVEVIKAALEDKKKESQEYLDRLQRTMAEFDNYKKRTAKEKQSIYHEAVSDTVSQLLPVLDNLERAVRSSQENADATKLLEGVEMVLKQFQESLFKLGVEEIKAEGESFNPELHNAVMHIEDESLGENIIVEEFQKGYKIKDKVIRHSMVKVAN